MYSRRIQYALDHFIMQDYFLSMKHSYHLKEEIDSGKSDLEVTINSENLCIYDFDHKKKCSFLRESKTFGMQKSVDHVLFENDSGGWRLHLIEMKSGVGYKTWLESIKPKVRTSYLTSLAIADFLGIKIIEAVAYITYEIEKFNNDENKANPKIVLPGLGMTVRDPLKDEWGKGQIFLNIGEEIIIPHKKIHMTRNEETGILEGNLLLQSNKDLEDKSLE